MCVMQNLVVASCLADELGNTTAEDTRKPHPFSGQTSEFDEDSDTPDPDTILNEEAREKLLCGGRCCGFARPAHATQLGRSQKAQKRLLLSKPSKRTQGCEREIARPGVCITGSSLTTTCSYNEGRGSTIRTCGNVAGTACASLHGSENKLVHTRWATSATVALPTPT